MKLFNCCVGNGGVRELGGGVFAARVMGVRCKLGYPGGLC